MKAFAVLGYWSSPTPPEQSEFLVCLGENPDDAVSRIAEGLSEYDANQRRQIDCLYLATWRGPFKGYLPCAELNTRSIKQSITANEYFARRRYLQEWDRRNYR